MYVVSEGTGGLWVEALYQDGLFIVNALRVRYRDELCRVHTTMSRWRLSAINAPSRLRCTAWQVHSRCLEAHFTSACQVTCAGCSERWPACQQAQQMTDSGGHSWRQAFHCAWGRKASRQRRAVARLVQVAVDALAHDAALALELAHQRSRRQAPPLPQRRARQRAVLRAAQQLRRHSGQRPGLLSDCQIGILWWHHNPPCNQRLQSGQICDNACTPAMRTLSVRPSL